MRILLIRRDNIGDLVCTTPVFRALRQHFPQARIDVLVNSYNAAILDRNPDVDHVYVYTKAHHRTRESVAAVFWRRVQVIRALRQVRYDWILLGNTRYNPRLVNWARWLNGRKVIGLTREGEPRTGLDIAITPPAHAVHEVESLMCLLQPFGIHQGEAQLRLVPDPKLALQARQRFSEEPLWIGLHLSARRPKQRWPEPAFVALIQSLCAQPRVRVALFWAPGLSTDPFHPGDDAKAQSVLAAVDPAMVMPCPTPSLPELVAGVSCVDVFVCADGGAMHVAAALGKPVVCLFGDADPAQWRPWGVPQRVLQAPDKDVASIPVAAVLRAVSEVWAWRSGSHPPPAAAAASMVFSSRHVLAKPVTGAVVLLGKGLDGLAEACQGLPLHVHRRVPETLDAVRFCLIDYLGWIRRPMALWRLKRRLNRAGVPLIGWNRDAPWHKGAKPWRMRLGACLGLLDFYATHSLQDAQRFPGHLVYLANGVWNERYHLSGKTLAQLRDPAQYEVDVSFLGNMDAKSYPEMWPRVQLLERLRLALEAEGYSVAWYDSQNMSVPEQVARIQKSRINLSIGAACDETGVSWGMPERCFGIPASGGFLLSDFRLHALLHFQVGQTWAQFTDMDDALRQIRYYLQHFAQSRDLAEASHHAMLSAETYRHRVELLLEMSACWQAQHP